MDQDNLKSSETVLWDIEIRAIFGVKLKISMSHKPTYGAVRMDFREPAPVPSVPRNSSGHSPGVIGGIVRRGQERHHLAYGSANCLPSTS